MSNTTTRLPQRGDIAARRISAESDYVYSDKDNVYFVQDDFVQGDLPANTYEILGVVAWRNKGEVLVVYKNNASNKWLARWQWTLTGYTLDGTERTGTLELTTDAAGATTADHIITYTATTLQEVCDAINAEVILDAGLVAQDVYAYVDGNTIQIQLNCSSYNQHSKCKGKNGFPLTTHNAPTETDCSTLGYRKNGGTNYGASGSFARYCYYFGNQAEATLTSQAPIKTSGYPVSKATYINSAYCSNLRSVYGDGEEGWLKYMKSQKPVRGAGYGVNGWTDGKARTKRMALQTYSSATKTDAVKFPAAYYCYNTATRAGLTTMNDGDWWLPTTNEIETIMQDVKYGTSGSRTADPLNAGLYKISGSSAISNGSHWWLCIRYNATYAWVVRGGNRGGMDGNGFFDSLSCVPVSLFKLQA